MYWKNTPHQRIVEPVRSNVKQEESDVDRAYVEMWFATEGQMVSVGGWKSGGKATSQDALAAVARRGLEGGGEGRKAIDGDRGKARVDEGLGGESDDGDGRGGEETVHVQKRAISIPGALT
jgi:hypothetical protein